MKKNDMQFLEIMQDPLLTMVALVLFGTLWIIIPGDRGGPAGKISPREIRAQLLELDKVVATLEAQINGHQAELDAMRNTQTDWSSSSLAAEKEANAEVSAAASEVERLKGMLAEKNKEYSQAQSRLEKQNQSQPEEAALIADLERRVRELEKEVYDREARRAENQKAIEAKAREATSEDPAKKGVASELPAPAPEKAQEEARKIPRQIELEEEQIAKLKPEREGLGKVVKDKRGAGEYTPEPVKGKKQIGFEADGGRLYLLVKENRVVKDNYETNSYIQVRGNYLTQTTEATRKPSTSGETITEIQGTTSNYRKILAGVTPEECYLVFLVKKDSFGLFLQARLIAEQAGFRVGWDPHKDKTIKLGEGEGGEPPVR